MPHLSLLAWCAFAATLVTTPLIAAAPAKSSTPTARYPSDSALVVNTRNFSGVAFDVLDVDPKEIDVRVHWRKPSGEPFETLAALRQAVSEEGRVFLAATNSGIYDAEFRPLGLHVERGKTLRKLNSAKGSGGNFSMRPNGVFLVGASGPRIVETSEYPRITDSVIEATQSGPLLLRNGVVHPEFRKGSANRKIRNGVGVTQQGRVVFAVSRDPVNFYDFASLFRDVLGCPDALYLDGTISQLLTKDERARDQAVPFVGIWSLSFRPPSH